MPPTKLPYLNALRVDGWLFKKGSHIVFKKEPAAVESTISIELLGPIYKLTRLTLELNVTAFTELDPSRPIPLLFEVTKMPPDVMDEFINRFGLVIEELYSLLT